ncbi:MAG: phytochelatin synthase family protein [Hyphomonadaceae bacterium]
MAHIRSPIDQDPDLVELAWALPVALLYRDDGYETQENWTNCGPTSAANLLQSMGLDLDQKEVVRHVGVRTFFGLIIGGMTLDQMAELLGKATARPVVIHRNLDLDTLRTHMQRANNPGHRFIANFDRRPLWGEGAGHFSPVLGYLDAHDQVFVGDVNDDFDPFLTPTERLLEALNAVDDDTGLARGLLEVNVWGAAPATR